ncbi:MAG: hypothetical protein MUC91_01545, partial [Verrucomicrobia bacterium]|nr:hypothetical protein [Verrucomicrobiota bacterium]
MTLRTLIRRSLRYHWRSHLGVVIGAAIGGAALIGALVVGDSVKGSLRAKALERLGATRFALSAGDRLFRDRLAGELQAVALDRDSRPIRLAPVLLLPGTVATSDASARANQVSVIGVESSSWRALSGNDAFPNSLQNDEVLLNAGLRQQLGVSDGDVLLVRVA